MNFASDNVAGAAPEILDALARESRERATPYGADPLTEKVTARFAEIFETDLDVFLVATGTAANALGLSAIVPPYGAVYSHEDAHIQVHEAGAPEFFSGGKIIPLPGDHGRLLPATIEDALSKAAPPVHHAKPSAVSISQITECGTAYTAADISALGETCRSQGLKLHMDGARFANAVVTANISPAAMSWQAGIDVLSFGATKNGALAAESIVFFDRAAAREFAYRRKRGGHLFSKMRFLAAQFDAYLTNGLWLTLAARANRAAARLASGLSEVPGIDILHPVDGNIVFAALPADMAAALQQQGFQFHSHVQNGRASVRLVLAFDTDDGDIDNFVSAAGNFGPATKNAAQ